MAATHVCWWCRAQFCEDDRFFRPGTGIGTGTPWTGWSGRQSWAIGDPGSCSAACKRTKQTADYTSGYRLYRLAVQTRDLVTCWTGYKQGRGRDSLFLYLYDRSSSAPQKQQWNQSLKGQLTENGGRKGKGRPTETNWGWGWGKRTN